MAQKKVGELVKEARTGAGLTQGKLAEAAGEGLTAADISKCEQGKADLSAAQLKSIAKICGVTQTSLVNAPKNLKATATAKTASAKTSAAKTTTAKTTSAKTTAAKKTDSKTTASKKTAAKTTTAKKPAASAAAKKPATPAGATTSMKLTAAEKKLIEAYREAPGDLKKAALKVLKGEYGETITTLLGAGTSSGSSAISDGITSVLGDVLGGLLGGK